jgi:membrane protein YqaA with SNARE-associated domain
MDILRCIGQSLITALMSGALAGALVGTLLGPMQAMSQRAEFRREWEQAKRKHGGWKAWMRKGAPVAIFFAVLLIIVQVVQCFQGSVP